MAGLGERRTVGTRRDARDLALHVLRRIDEGAYANLTLRVELERSGLDARDRALVTELVYGVTRLRRRLDHLVDRFLLRPVDPPVRAALRLGAYQLHELGTPPHAAVSATVSAVTERRAKGLVNAVLRKVASAPVPEWPSEAVRLSYPDWVVERLVADLGRDDALGALDAMDERAQATERADGYVQDLASQWVAELVGARRGERIADLAAAPGGKTTALATAGAWVAASDVRAGRAGLVVGNVARLGQGASVAVVVADGTAPPYRTASFDRVLLDAPCSGFGSFRRRPDARWRIEPDSVERLADLQDRLLVAARGLVAPGGTLVYAVCTLTQREGPAVAATVDWPSLPPPPEPWRPWGTGAVLLPQAAGTDGMYVARWRRPH
jgi:16S rRNA (cytosine967-C5)-methyltransferase